MSDTPTRQCIAFDGSQRIASGCLSDVATAIQQAQQSPQRHEFLIFDAQTSELLEVDTRGSTEEVARRYAGAAAPAASPACEEVTAAPAEGPRGRGRPRLGVVAREVTLLPRHWEWLATQPGGASVALRKLVEQARRDNAPRDAVRKAREAAYRFMSAIASPQETFEEATRALFADDRMRFEELVSSWPADVRQHLLVLAQLCFKTA